MAVGIKITVFCNVTPCTIIDTNISEEPTAPIFSIEKQSSALKMKATGSSKMMVSVYRTIWCHILGHHKYVGR
jgi:hypothetical protein